MKHEDKIEEVYSSVILAESKEELEKSLINLIKLIPNNYELGELIRNAYSNTKNKK